jgi:hypothetical protein
MPSENRPATKQSAPDPATSYERAKPENEAGMGTLSAEDVVPDDNPDRGDHAASNRHEPRQINARDNDDQRTKVNPSR